MRLLIGSVMAGLLCVSPITAQEDCDPCDTTLDFCGICHKHNDGSDWPNPQNHLLDGTQYPNSCNGSHGTNEECRALAMEVLNAASAIDHLSRAPMSGSLDDIEAAFPSVVFIFRQDLRSLEVRGYCEQTGGTFRLLVPFSLASADEMVIRRLEILDLPGRG